MNPDQVIVIAGGVGLLLVLVLYLLNRRPKLDSDELQDDESPFADLMNRHVQRKSAAAASVPPPRPLRNPSDHFEAGWDAAVSSVPPPPGTPQLSSLKPPRLDTPTPSKPEAPPPTNEPALIAALQRELARGQKIHAIKELREACGLGLKECKEGVEHLARTGRLPAAIVSVLHASEPRGNAPSDLSATEQSPPATTQLTLTDPRVLETAKQWLEEGKKIHAIKEVRSLTGVSLKAAKDFVESL